MCLTTRINTHITEEDTEIQSQVSLFHSDMIGKVRIWPRSQGFWSLVMTLNFQYFVFPEAQSTSWSLFFVNNK